ncbi:MAG TPA: hypothetical protein VHK90_16580, partial [Thermoanaerobaculia bacterium]|nr:hypothetical protein [Thermoanaerobaculia bacterium]
MPDADSSPALDALRIECEQHQETLRRAARSNDRVGMLTPLVGIVLVLPLVTGMRVHEQRLA